MNGDNIYVADSLHPLKKSETMKLKSEIHQYFDVPFFEKEIAKKMGAKWDPVKKLWFTTTDEIKTVLSSKFNTKF